MTDLLLIETGNGGDLLFRGNDLVQVSGLETAIYVAMFGDDGSGCWMNYMLPDAQQFISQTQAALKNNALTSAGRINIERAMQADLSFLDNIDGTTWSVATFITGANAIQMTVTVNGQTFSMVYNPDSLFLTYTVPNYL